MNADEIEKSTTHIIADIIGYPSINILQVPIINHSQNPEEMPLLMDKDII